MAITAATGTEATERRLVKKGENTSAGKLNVATKPWSADCLSLSFSMATARILAVFLLKLHKMHLYGKLMYVKETHQKVIIEYAPILLAVALLELAVIGFGIYSYRNLSTKFTNLQTAFATTTDAYKADILALQNDLTQKNNEKNSLASALSIEQTRNQEFDSKIKDLQNNVGTLVKLSNTDKELLQKYSKVYFLSENYVPASLVDITNSEYNFDRNKTLKFHLIAWSYLQKMLFDATQSGNYIKIISGYRSFDEQTSLKQNYKFTYGSGANQFSADQGYSEHQLGTAVDLTAVSIGASFEKIEKTPVYKWLTDNAHKYGFILSYPKDNGYYQFEPWHWRFVGVKLATKLHDDNKHFYDLDQREIDQYLVNIFD